MLSLIESLTLAVPDPPSLTVPQIPGDVQPGFQVVLSYDPLLSGKVGFVAGAAASTSIVSESLPVAADGRVTPFAAEIDCTPGAAGEAKAYVVDS